MIQQYNDLEVHIQDKTLVLSELPVVTMIHDIQAHRPVLSPSLSFSSFEFLLSCLSLEGNLVTLPSLLIHLLKTIL